MNASLNSCRAAGNQLATVLTRRRQHGGSSLAATLAVSAQQQQREQPCCSFICIIVIHPPLNIVGNAASHLASIAQPMASSIVSSAVGSIASPAYQQSSTSHGLGYNCDRRALPGPCCSVLSTLQPAHHTPKLPYGIAIAFGNAIVSL